MPRHRSHRRLRKARPSDTEDDRLVLLALASATLSERVADGLQALGVTPVQLVDEEGLERYLFRRNAPPPDVVVWQVGLASLAALDAVWRAHQAGFGPRLVLVGETVAEIRGSRSGCGVRPGALVYARPEADQILEQVAVLLARARPAAALAELDAG